MEDYDLVDISEDKDNEKLTLKVSAVDDLVGLLPYCGQFPYYLRKNTMEEGIIGQ